MDTIEASDKMTTGGLRPRAEKPEPEETMEKMKVTVESTNLSKTAMSQTPILTREWFITTRLTLSSGSGLFK